MKPDLWCELEMCIRTMKIPSQKKVVNSLNTVRWLCRNMKVANESHKNFEIASDLIQIILGKKGKQENGNKPA